MRVLVLALAGLAAVAAWSPILAQDSLTATIKEIDGKGNIVLQDGSKISIDEKMTVEGTPEVGAKVSVVFSGDENGYEITKIVISK
jgi:hypothetical protein